MKRSHRQEVTDLIVPRLSSQLFSSDIHIRVGDQDFQISRELFSKPGNSPNYFTLGFSTYFTGALDKSPGLQQGSLARPPTIVPPTIVNRSASIFSDLLHVLKGYDLEIRSEKHRADLLRDARYFHLKGLEQQLIPHEITYNLARQRSEILLRLDDIRKEGLSVCSDQQNQAPHSGAQGSRNIVTTPGWIIYQRPHVDQSSHTLVVEIAGDESATLSVAPAASNTPVRLGLLTLYGKTLSTINRLFEVIVSKSTPAGLQSTSDTLTRIGSDARNSTKTPPHVRVIEDRVKIRIGPDADVIINGRRWTIGHDDQNDEGDLQRDNSHLEPPLPQQTSSTETNQETLDLVLNRSQWRIRVQPNNTASNGGKPAVEMILGAVKIDGFSNERARNAARSFLDQS